MGTYLRTVEMGRFERFRCHRCGDVMHERLATPTDLELTCERCRLVLAVHTSEPIPRAPLPHGSVLYRPGKLLEHGTGLRGHNCAALLVDVGKGGAGPEGITRIKCGRCHTVHKFSSAPSPTPARPSTFAASSSPAATPA